MSKLTNRVICIILGLMLLLLSACSTDSSGKNTSDSGSDVEPVIESDNNDISGESNSENDSEESTSEVEDKFVILNRLDGADVNLTGRMFSDYLSLTDKRDMARFMYEDYLLDEKRLYVESRTMNFKWEDKNSGASSYNFILSDTEDFSNEIIKKDLSATTFEVADLLPGTYYYKVRSYKTVDGKKVYSDYSKVKNIKSK